MKKIYLLVAISLLTLCVLSCSKSDGVSIEQTQTQTNTTIVEKTSTKLTLQVKSFGIRNFDFTGVEVWVTDKSIYTNGVPTLPTAPLEKIQISKQSEATLDTEKYIDKKLYFNVFKSENGKIRQYLSPRIINNQVSNENTDGYELTPKKGVEVTATLFIR